MTPTSEPDLTFAAVTTSPPAPDCKDPMKLKKGSPRFISNRCIAVHVTDLDRAAAFYGNAMGFPLLSRTNDQLEYDTGVLRLYVNRSAESSAPIPSFSVSDIAAAKRRLLESGCTIIDDRGGSLYFKDPFGAVFDVVED
jgi:catechol 2,3-dioxygenase-like lactoylglutathione lyase family enzyme